MATVASHQAPSTQNRRYSTFEGQQIASYRSIFRDYIAHDRFTRQRRPIREVDPPTLLAVELYIYLFTYTQLTHDDVCIILFHVMQEVDWEMLALLDEARDLRVPNIYDAEDNVEEEDLWTQIRGLPDTEIASSFKGLMQRLDAMGFSVTRVLRPQMGRETWVVVWEGRRLPVERQPALVHSRFDIDPAAIVDYSQSNPYQAVCKPPAPRLIGFLHGPGGESSQILDSMDHMEVYQPGEAGEDDVHYNTEDESDEELARVLELSRKEF